MTDTTDIKALREGLVELLDHVDSYGGKCWLFPEDVRSIISSLDQLEAERQLAAGSEEELHKALHREKAAERKLLAAQEEIAALKAKLANPVALPERKKAEFYVDGEFSNKDLAAIYNCAILELKKKIHAAGFTTVKDGE